ncbi:hypothetical protein DFH06DRAFT_729509 [Mycena polygramma]|nr:hypothetical protein DFH06DRAFT_729509 [Mycena polygramma]
MPPQVPHPALPMSSTDGGGLSHDKLTVLDFVETVLYLDDSYPVLAKSFGRYQSFEDHVVVLFNLLIKRKVFVPLFQDGGEPSRSLLVEPPTPGATADASGTAVFDNIDTPSLPPILVEDPDDTTSVSFLAPTRGPSGIGNFQSTPVFPAASFETVGSPILFPDLSTPIGDVSIDGPLQSTPRSPAAAWSPISFPPLSTPLGDIFDQDGSEISSAPVPNAANPNGPPITPFPPFGTDAPSGHVAPSESAGLSTRSTQTDGLWHPSFLGIPETVHEFLLTPTLMALIPSFLRSSWSRIPRGVELRLPPPVVEIVFWPSMGRKLVEYLRAKPGEDLSKLKLTPELYHRLMSGPTVANCSKRVTSEADVEHGMKLGQCTVVAELINYQENRFGLEHKDRLFPHRGTPGCQSGQKSHAFSDIVLDGPGEEARKKERLNDAKVLKQALYRGGGALEIKPNTTINADFIPTLFNLSSDAVDRLVEEHPDAGLKFAFNYPQTFTDLMPPVTQPLIQIWTQLHENLYNFAQGSSHEHSFSVIKDPETPNRLYVSHCYETPFIPTSDTPMAKLGDPAESALYIMYSLFRIANKPAYAEEFLEKLREEMCDNLISVHSRDVTLAGTLDAPPVPVANGSRGKVGVRYHGEAETKKWQDILRKPTLPAQTNPVVDEPTASDDEPEADNDHSFILDRARKQLAPPSKIPGPLLSAKPRKTLAAMTRASKDSRVTQTIPPPTASGSAHAKSTFMAPTEASRGRVVEAAQSPLRRITRSRSKAKGKPPQM